MAEAGTVPERENVGVSPVGETLVVPRAAPNLSAADFVQESSLCTDYGFLVVTSCLIATFGLLADSAAAIIGAMIIAPLMLPIRGLSFGVLSANLRLVRVSGKALVVGVFMAILLSTFLGVLVPLPELGREVAARTQPNLLDLGVALVAGAVSGYAKVRGRIGDAIAGTAIAVALMPPLCSVGLLLANGKLVGAWGAALLFLTNLLGIALACMLVFFVVAGVRSEGTRQALAWSISLTLVLAVPLGYSLSVMVEQNFLLASIRRALVTKTLTVGRDTELVSAKMVWTATRPEAHVLVRARRAPTERQVALLESFLSQELAREITLVMLVDQVIEVRREAPHVAPSPAPDLPADGVARPLSGLTVRPERP